jgi:oxygen-dependent protoporphyrinogen oxidase
MRGKLLFVTGAAVGYVLGTRAGRKRYEQMRSAALKVWESPGVQKQVNAVEDFVAEKIGEVPEAVYITVKKAVVRANDRRREARQAGPQPSGVAVVPATRDDHQE